MTIIICNERMNDNILKHIANFLSSLMLHPRHVDDIKNETKYIPFITDGQIAPIMHKILKVVLVAMQLKDFS